MKKKLVVHGYPAGAGKTYSICEKIKSDRNRYLIAVPTKKLQSEYAKMLPDALVINDDDSKNVSQYIAYQQSIIDSNRVVIITHVTLLTHGDKFGIDRELIIDELPSDLICTDHVITAQVDAIKFQQEIELSTKEDLKEFIDRYEIDQEHRRSKIRFFEQKLSNPYFAYITSAFTSADNRKHVNFQYLYLADIKLFNNYSTIHLLGANLTGSIAIKYFVDLAGYELVKGNLSVRGNPMEQKVRIVPLLNFVDGKRDFVSKAVLDKYFDQILSVVRDNTNQGALIATNKAFEEVVKADNHFEVISAKSHGLNAYSHVNEAAVIYSANPNPYDIAFMQTCAAVLGFDTNALVDAYIYENVLDMLYQTVTRTAIRDPNYKNQLTFFVPDLRCAEFLDSKFSNCYIDWTLAIDVEVDKGGAQIGNTNNKGKGCPVIQYLVSSGVKDSTARRYKKMFEKTYGIKPKLEEPSHKIKLMAFKKSK